MKRSNLNSRRNLDRVIAPEVIVRRRESLEICASVNNIIRISTKGHDYSQRINDPDSFPDCEIVFKDKDRRIDCHRVFLMQSPVFRAYFNSPLCKFENGKCVYVIEDDDDEPIIFLNMIRCLYNSTFLYIKDEELIAFIHIIEKYELVDVLERIGGKIKKVLDNNNILDYWETFSRFNASNTGVSVCEEYIVHNMKEIISSGVYLEKSTEFINAFLSRFYYLCQMVRNSIIEIMASVRKVLEQRDDEKAALSQLFDVLEDASKKSNSTTNKLIFGPYFGDTKQALVTLRNVTFVIEKKRKEYSIKPLETDRVMDDYFTIMIKKSDTITVRRYGCHHSNNSRGGRFGDITNNVKVDEYKLENGDIIITCDELEEELEVISADELTE